MQSQHIEITGSLEDYLETIYITIRDNKIARVKDIAKARDVTMSSVTTALKRLDEMGLVKYSRREYIELTAKGEKEARRILSRHDILRRFLTEILGMKEENAEVDACALEHHLSDEAMDKFARFFEFLGRCCDDEPSFLQRFHKCSAVHPEIGDCAHYCAKHGERHSHRWRHGKKAYRTAAELKPGETGVIAQVNATGAIRQRLLDMGMLPKVEITLERAAPTGDPLWIRMQGFQLSIRRSEAERILIEKSS